MSTKYNNVIIFGPTGDVGSIAAQEANSRGAKVWLAMRNPEKSIEGITSDQEEQGSYARIKADLNDPKSVKAAIEESKAKAAYFYFVPSRTSLGGSVQAMKDAGIEYIVFLSSSSIGLKDIRTISPAKDLIAFGHAQVEIALEDSGVPFTALRPGFFASNSLKHNLDTSTTPWEAVLMRNKGIWDNVSPIDIGRVAGSVLVDRPSTSSKEIIFLYGPKMLTQDEMWDTIRKAASQEIKMTFLSSEDYRQHMIKKDVPPPFADYLVKELENIDSEGGHSKYKYDEGVANVEKYTGRKSQSFADYLAQKAP